MGVSVDPSSEVVVAAPAKVNLVLRILDRRPDGYHNLWSLMQTVGLTDELRIRLCDATGTLRLQCSDPNLPTDGRNLVHRAATAVLQQSGQSVGMDIQILKRIPTGGGLGGGSSDAAATIMALTKLLRLDWSTQDMARLGQSLGSDVPFFFYAPTACVRGRGEDVKPLRLAGDRWIVLVNPGFPVPTRWAYEQLGRTRQGVRRLSERHQAMMSDASLGWEEVVPLMENDFEAALENSHPELGKIKRALLACGAEGALLSGSGATVFGVFKTEKTARQAEHALCRQTNHAVFAVPACAAPISCPGEVSSAQSPVG